MSVLMGLGASSEANVYIAGQEAARQMLAHLGGSPQLTLVFSSIRFADPKLLSGIRSVTEGAPLIGCTGAGGISTWGPMRQSVIVIGLRGANASFVTGVAHGISKDPEGAGKRLAQDLKAAEPGEVKGALIFPAIFRRRYSDGQRSWRVMLRRSGGWSRSAAWLGPSGSSPADHQGGGGSRP